MKGSNRRTFPMTVSDRTTVGSFAASDGAPPTPSAVFRVWECGTSRSTILTNRVSDDGLQLRPMPSPSPPSASRSPPCYAMRVTAVNATAAIVQLPHGGSDSTRDHPCGTTAFYRSLSSEHRSACTSSLDHSSVPRSSRFMPGQLHSRRSRTSVVHPTAREVANLPDQPHRVMLRSGRIASHGRLSRTVQCKRAVPYGVPARIPLGDAAPACLSRNRRARLAGTLTLRRIGAQRCAAAIFELCASLTRGIACVDRRVSAAEDRRDERAYLRVPATVRACTCARTYSC